MSFYCSKCDAQFIAWQGRCTECGAWGTVVVDETDKKNTSEPTKTGPIANLTNLTAIATNSLPRISTGISELDRVLGGGMVPGSLILLGGDPGIGKSTLVLQIIAGLKNSNQSLYISGEESGHQIKNRLDRLNIGTTEINFAAETNTQIIIDTIAKLKPTLAIIDSIQTIALPEVSAEIGSPNQIKASTAKLLEVAKKNNTIIIIIGHITKDGVLAGPKTLEHLVDTVLYLEGDSQTEFRLLRSVKNRFGATNEVGVFEMTGRGLETITNPSANFLSNYQNTPGTVVTCTLAGSRAFLVEIQALVTKTVFGYPQRKAVGYDLNRLQILIAVLTKRLGLPLGTYDVYLNVAGGLKITETAADLAVCEAIITALNDTPPPTQTVVFGEVGLGGEIRSVPQTEKRLKEAGHLGFKSAILPTMKTAPATNLRLLPKQHLKEL